MTVLSMGSYNELVNTKVKSPLEEGSALHLFANRRPHSTSKIRHSRGIRVMDERTSNEHMENTHMTILKLSETVAIDTHVCQACNEGPVLGSKIIDREAFISHLEFVIKSHKFDEDREPGQGFLKMPKTAFESVSPGDGPRTQDPGHYTVALHRGRVDAYLIREQAGRTAELAVIVYTAEAYLSDPEVGDVDLEGATHVIVAVLASSAPESPLPVYRLVSNLAGGNKEALQWGADEIRAKAAATKTYWDEFEVVYG